MADARAQLDWIVRANRSVEIERMYNGPIPESAKRWVDNGRVADAERISDGLRQAEQLDTIATNTSDETRRHRLSQEAARLRGIVAEVKAEQRSHAA